VNLPRISQKDLVKAGDGFVLHETQTGIQQVKARFVEDGRGITHLHIQRWSTKTGKPIGEQVVLSKSRRAPPSY
jgi:hypothetical protein